MGVNTESRISSKAQGELTRQRILDLVESESDETGWYRKGQVGLAESFGISTRNVRRHVKLLESQGLLKTYYPGRRDFQCFALDLALVLDRGSVLDSGSSYPAPKLSEAPTAKTTSQNQELAFKSAEGEKWEIIPPEVGQVDGESRLMARGLSGIPPAPEPIKAVCEAEFRGDCLCGEIFEGDGIVEWEGIWFHPQCLYDFLWEHLHDPEPDLRFLALFERFDRQDGKTLAWAAWLDLDEDQRVLNEQVITEELFHDDSFISAFSFISGDWASGMAEDVPNFDDLYQEHRAEYLAERGSTVTAQEWLTGAI